MTLPRWPLAYAMIGAHHESSPAELKDAFADALMNSANDPEQRAAVLEAWETLGDPAKRSAYDRQPIAGPDRGGLVEALRPLVLLPLLWLAAAVVLLWTGSRAGLGVVGGAYIIAAVPYGWRALDVPFRVVRPELVLGMLFPPAAIWPELTGAAMRLVVAVPVGAYGAPFLASWPLVKWMFPRRADLARRFVELVSTAAGRARAAAWRESK